MLPFLQSGFKIYYNPPKNTTQAACVTEHVFSHLTSAPAYFHPYVRVLHKLVHVDALRVEDGLLLAALGGSFAEQTARQSSGFQDDGILGQCCHH